MSASYELNLTNMSRPKGSKNKPKKERVVEIDGIQLKAKDIVDSDIDSTSVEPLAVLKGIYATEGVFLFKALKDSGFPQGGVGNWVHVGDERVYVPNAQEIYSQFVSDPEGWMGMTEAMARVWIKNSEKEI
jgi:hypothetical protein